MSLRTLISSRRDQIANRKRAALKFVPAIQGLENRRLLSNTPPVVGDGSVSTLHDQPVSGTLFNYDQDGDQTTVSLAGGPSNGAVTVNGDGSFTYTPNPGYVGQDSFTFEASDGIADSGTATETIDVTNQAPVAGEVDASVSSTPYDPGTVDINLLSDAYDPDGDPVTLVSHGAPTNGTLTDDGNGVVTYAPDPNTAFVGVVQFPYTVTDGILTATGIAMVSVTSVKVNIVLRQSGDFSPDDQAAQEAKDYSGATQLGPMDPGSGPAGGVQTTQSSYVNQIEVVGTVPAEASNLQYSWSVSAQLRVWKVTSDGATWTATQTGEEGFPDPDDDSPLEEFTDTTPDPTTNNIFMTDTSGVELAGMDVNIGDYVRSERNFVFSVYVTLDGVPKEAGELKMSQTIIAKKVANTGTVAKDWQGIQNSYQAGAVDCTINQAEVRAMVGGALPIVIDPGANQ
jgi:hypothetical protein